uniref:FYVE, RhoGEF and PH domain containing 6 n=2 Tax=Seriola dumerili TaxID=41447 RepID=A0A3B4VKM9_SERDU
MNSGMYKPPLAPKPKLVQPQRPGLSPSTPRREGLSIPSPGTPRRVKPVLAPKPCLSKLTSAVESKPLISKSLHQTSVTGNPRTVGLLNGQNGIQQENKKPDWDYIIPICLCSQENCQCIRNTSASRDKTEKVLKTLHKGKAEENRKLLPTSQGVVDGRERTDAAKSQVTSANPPQNVCLLPAPTNTHLTNHKPLQEMLTLDKNLNTDISTSSPVVRVRPSLPHRTWSDEVNGNVIPQSAPGRGPKEDALGSEQILSVPQSKPVPAAPRKPVPVPRKPKTAVLVGQEKVEKDREEIINQEGREMNVKEVRVSSERKDSSSLSVSVPVSENKQPIVLPLRKACAPPAPPPKKKPFLSAPEKVPTSAPETLPKDVDEEDLGWDISIYEMEISVDKEDEEVEREMEGEEDQKAVYSDLTRCPPHNSLLSHPQISQPPAYTVAPQDGVVKVRPTKPQRHSSPMPFTQRQDSSEETEEGKLGDNGKRQALPRQDSVFQDRVMRELPLPPDEKTSRDLLTAGIKPLRGSLGKQRAKSFSTADLTRSEGQRRNSFRKLLDLKLSVKMLPKLIVRGSQSPDCTGDDNEQSVDKDQEACQNFPESLRAERKFSCPLIGVEQSVDGDDCFPGIDEAVHYENVRHYEEIPDYINVHVGKAGSSSRASLSQPSAWDSELYNDEGIYEEQEPYMSFEKNTGHQQCQTPTDYERNSANEESAPLGDGPSDDDIAANISSSDEEDNDSSSISSKGDPEQPEESTTQSGEKKNKIHHIATEIMSSESVFVDVLKLLHVDFRDAVSKASRQNGKPVIEERLLNQILYYLPQLYELNQDLLRELKQRLAKWDENAQLADIFLKKGPYLKMYSTYIREYDKNVALLEEQSKRNPAFGAVVREFETGPRCANLALKHYLLKPVQRIPQYQLLFTDYLKNLSEDSDDYKDTQAALALVKEVANHANDIMKQGDNFQKLIQVQCSLNGHHEIVQPGRIFLKEGFLMKLARKVMQPRKFFLFNDTLLYTTPVQSGQYKLNNMLCLAGMRVSKPSQEAYQNELNIESVERSFILSASSATERDEWLEAISTAISDYTKRKISFISGKPLEEVELSDSGDGAPLGSKAPIWIPDPRTTMCMICTCEFSLTWRRHHCRACGKVVCQSCSSNKYRLEYLKNQLARVCDQCFCVLHEQTNERSLSSAVSPGNRAAFAFSRKQKKIPAALKEVTANTDNSTISGYLQRFKGNKKQGKRLWFVIKDKVLYTYAASEDVAALESQPLLGFMLKEDSSETLQFKLYHKNTLYYIFKAEDEQTAQRWINSFKEATVL